jgi:hypothetical protein
LIHEIQQAIWLETPKGLALAKFLVDRGIDSDNEWICIVNETGEIWSFDNSDVQVCKSLTLGRRCEWEKPTPIKRSTPNSMSRMLRKV